MNSYVLAVLGTSAVSLILTFLGPVFEGSPPLLLFLTAVMPAAWNGGLAAGFFATALSTFVGAYFLVEPEFSLDVAVAAERLRLLLLFSVGMLLSLVIDRLKKAEAQAAKAALDRDRELKTEIIEHWETEQKLRDEEIFAHKVLMSSLNGLYIYDIRTGTDIFINAQYTRLTGYTLDDLNAIRGRAFFALFHPDDQERIAAHMENLARIADGEVEEIEYRFKTADGRWIWCLSRDSVFSRDPDGGVRQCIGAFLDITERKQAEQALRESDRRKDEFLAMLGHELRNPLAPIRNAVKVMKKIGLPHPKLSWAGDVIDRQVNQLANLVDDLLDVTRIVQGKITLHKTEVEMDKVIDLALETSRPMIEARHHELNLSLPEGPLWLNGDTMRLAQVVGNLLNNAAKYTPEGGTIWLSAVCRDGDAMISVRDTGEGIPKNLLPKLFNLFTQAERTLDRAQGGLGLGLTIVQKIVELHGGWVEAKSEGLGKGSEFIVCLPACKAGMDVGRRVQSAPS
ncbi:multi-sensor hybrid histidine kinase [Methylocaldum marinum]|uniref:histidine kinase n=1 Tax=Methylocaldum marinum TaxID=1432792 RepID=A0A250KTJ0_9GAMM|nr:ATP-binding protein [Methylocaldum marinum]BBA34970.1 multi-sensor hybrid histidine kinase [Methylocaldum marinum]